MKNIFETIIINHIININIHIVENAGGFKFWKQKQRCPGEDQEYELALPSSPTAKMRRWSSWPPTQSKQGLLEACRGHRLLWPPRSNQSRWPGCDPAVPRQAAGGVRQRSLWGALGQGEEVGRGALQPLKLQAEGQEVDLVTELGAEEDLCAAIIESAGLMPNMLLIFCFLCEEVHSCRYLYSIH